MNPTDPRNMDLARTRSRDMNRSEGLSAIAAVVAVAGVIIAALLYILQPQTESPNGMTNEAPIALPAPAPKPGQ